MFLKNDVGIGSRSQCFVCDFLTMLKIPFSETLLNSVSWTWVSEHSWSSVGLVSPASSNSDIVLNSFSNMSMILLVKYSLNLSTSCCVELVSRVVRLWFYLEAHCRCCRLPCSCFCFGRVYPGNTPFQLCPEGWKLLFSICRRACTCLHGFVTRPFPF